MATRSEDAVPAIGHEKTVRSHVADNFSISAAEPTPTGRVVVASHFPDAGAWLVEHDDEVTQVKDALEEVLRHVVGKLARQMAPRKLKMEVMIASAILTA